MSDEKKWHELTEEERKNLVAWLSGEGNRPAPPYHVRRAAADALAGPLWGEAGDTW
jgi:hypothetical protein